MDYAVDNYDNLMVIIRQSLTNDVSRTIEANSAEGHLPSIRIDLHPGVKYPRPRANYLTSLFSSYYTFVERFWKSLFMHGVCIAKFCGRAY